MDVVKHQNTVSGGFDMFAGNPKEDAMLARFYAKEDRLLNSSNKVKNSFSWTTWLFNGVQEASRYISNLTEGSSKCSQVDPRTVMAGCGFVVGCVAVVKLVQSVCNKTETKLVDPVTPLISSTSELETDSSTEEKTVKLTASSDEVKGKVPLRQRSKNWNKVAAGVLAIRLAPSVGNKTETKLVDRATPLISSTSEFEKDSSTEEKTVKLKAPLDEVKGIAVDPISKAQRIYEFIFRVNSKRTPLRQTSEKMNPLCSEILQPTSSTSLISSTSKLEKDSATEEKMVKLTVPLDEVKGA